MVSTKKITGAGSVSIPVHLRRQLGIARGDALSLSINDKGELVFSPVTDKCEFCEGDVDVAIVYGRRICKGCATKAIELLGGNAG